MTLATVQAGSAGLGGEVAAIPSKSQAHRALICAALAGELSQVACAGSSADIEATVACLRALGARIERDASGFTVVPLPPAGNDPVGMDRSSQPAEAMLADGDPVGRDALGAPPEGNGSVAPIDLPCGESGSTLRFLLPVVGALGLSAAFHREGRLSARPLSPLYEELAAHGCTLSAAEDEPLLISGQLTPGDYYLDASVSSQFISGLLFAFPLINATSTLHLTGTLESRPYVEMTLAALRAAGIVIAHENEGDNEETFTCAGPQSYLGARALAVEGDWSNAAFWLCAGALSARPVTVTGLDLDSPQGDRAILDILRRFGATVSCDASRGAVTVTGGTLSGIKVSAQDTPDLVPVLAAVATAATGTTTITGAARLRIKESDRLAAVCDVLGRLGAHIKETTDGLVISGPQRLAGGDVDAWGDHRIAMMAAIAAVRSQGPVLINGAEAVNKSYPQFFEDFVALGGWVRSLSSPQETPSSLSLRGTK